MSSLEAQALDRKSRLAALRSKRSRNESPTPVNQEEEQTSEPCAKRYQASKGGVKEVLVRRNFDLRTKEHIDAVGDTPTFNENGTTVEAISADIERKILSGFQDKAAELISEFVSLQNAKKEDPLPKGNTDKAASDLEHKLKADLHVLEQRTEEAIKRLVRKRIVTESTDEG